MRSVSTAIRSVSTAIRSVTIAIRPVTIAMSPVTISIRPVSLAIRPVVFKASKNGKVCRHKKWNYSLVCYITGSLLSPRLQRKLKKSKKMPYQAIFREGLYNGDQDN